MRHVFSVQKSDGTFPDIGMLNRWIRIDLTLHGAIMHAHKAARERNASIRVETWNDSEFYKPNSVPQIRIVVPDDSQAGSAVARKRNATKRGKRAAHVPLTQFKGNPFNYSTHELEHHAWANGFIRETIRLREPIGAIAPDGTRIDQWDERLRAAGCSPIYRTERNR